MNEKKEVESSKKIVTNTDSGEKGAVLGSVNVKTAKKISKKQLIISSIILLVILIIVGLLVALNDKNSQNQEAQDKLNSLMSTAPSNEDEQYEWSKKTSEQLVKDGLYKNGDTATKTDYYNKLIGLYINQKSEKQARDLYMNEIHKNGILINSNYLNWLYKNYLLIDNKEAAVMAIDDLIAVYNKDYELATEQTDKAQISQSIDELKAKKRDLSK